jgi:hypothetical protein
VAGVVTVQARAAQNAYLYSLEKRGGTWTVREYRARSALAAEHPAQSNDGAHDLDVDRDRARAPQDARQHGDACSVKTRGSVRRPPHALEVTSCDFK